VLRDAPPRRPGVRDDEDPADAPANPASVARYLEGQAGLPVECEHRGLQVGDHRLDLDDEDRAGLRMEGKDIDRSALASDVERDLDRDIPRQSAQCVRDDLDELGVVGVQQAVQRLSVPGK
jgi:hypothetical protein